MLDKIIGRGQNDPGGRAKVGLGSTRRPVIGLALGGGAARGFAHIGVIRTLLAHGIVPDVVVGTSIGAVVGGAYAAGHLDHLEAWARSLQPRNILGYLDIRLNGSGLIGGDKLAAQLEAAMGETLIEELPLKFADHRHRSPHRSRDMAHARAHGRCTARFLRATRDIFAGAGGRPLAGGRRAGQSGAGIGGHARLAQKLSSPPTSPATYLHTPRRSTRTVLPLKQRWRPHRRSQPNLPRPNAASANSFLPSAP